MATEPGRRKDLDEAAEKWLDLAQARRELGFVSEDAVRAWADWGWLRSRRDAAGHVEVSRSDVLAEKQRRIDLEALGGDELTDEELEEMAEWQGRLPWEREGAETSH